MKNSIKNIKWAGLIPSLEVFSGEIGKLRISLISKGDFYELRVNNAGNIHLNRIEKKYLSIEEKKDIISTEFCKYIS